MLVKKKLLAAFSEKAKDPGISSHRFVVTQDTMMVNNTTIMRISFFLNKEVVNTMFTDGENFQCLLPSGEWTNKWLTKENYISYGWNEFVCKDADKTAISAFLGVNENENSMQEILYTFRRRKSRKHEAKAAVKRRDKKAEKQRRIEETICALRENVKKREPQYKEFAKTIFSFSYGIFHVGKNLSVTCLSCGKEFQRQPEIRAGIKSWCPHCKKELILYSSQKNMKRVHDSTKFYLPYKDGDKVIIASVVVYRTFDEERKPEYSFAADGCQVHKEGSYTSNIYTYERASTMFPTPYMWREWENQYLCFNDWSSKNAPLFTKNLHRVFGKEWNGIPYEEIKRYAKEDAELFAKELATHLVYRKDLFKRYGLMSFYQASSIELCRLFDEKKLKAIRSKKTPTFSDMFDLLPDMKSVFLKCQITPGELKAMRIIPGIEKMYVSEEQIQKIRKLKIKDFSLMREHNIGLQKFLNYLEKQLSLYPEENVDYILREWRDYCSTCERIGIDLGKKQNLFPSRLLDEYQLYLDLIRKEKNTSRIEKLQALVDAAKEKEKVLAAYAKFEGYTDGVYTIHFPVSASEFIKQGDVLCICVGNFDKYAINHFSGEAPICFITRNSCPERAFFTMELSMTKKEIHQLRGYRNCQPTAEVQDFCDHFLKEFFSLNEKEVAA